MTSSDSVVRTPVADPQYLVLNRVSKTVGRRHVWSFEIWAGWQDEKLAKDWATGQRLSTYHVKLLQSPDQWQKKFGLPLPAELAAGTQGGAPYVMVLDHGNEEKISVFGFFISCTTLSPDIHRNVCLEGLGSRVCKGPYPVFDYRRYRTGGHHD